MKIKEQYGQRMLIVSSFSERIGWILLAILPIAIAGFAIFFKDVGGYVFAAVFGLFVLASPQGKAVVIDKLTADITIKERRFLLIKRQRVIQFSEVTRVNVVQNNIMFYNIFAQIEHFFPLARQYYFSFFGRLRITYEGYKAWQVNLMLDREQVRIDRTPKESDMRVLASKIGEFIGKP